MVTVQLHDSSYASITALLESQLHTAENISVIECGHETNDYTRALKGVIGDFKEGIKLTKE